MDEWDPRVCERAPAMWPLRRAAERFASYRDWPELAAYGDGPLRFEPAPRRRRRVHDPAQSYDGRIHLSRSVPTRRNNWHDWFNALVWATFPRAKEQLHARQYHARARRETRQRSREEDALTLLDEGGIVLLCGRPHAEATRCALARRADGEVDELAERGALIAAIFGHALYENLASAGPPVRGMVALVIGELGGGDVVARIDRGLAELLATAGSFAQPTGHGSLPLTAACLRRPAGGLLHCNKTG